MPDTYVYILSGRGRQHLDSWFGKTGVGLVAEHGCFYKHPRAFAHLSSSNNGNGNSNNGDTDTDPMLVRRSMGDGWYCLVEDADNSWRDTIMPLFRHYTERTPGSFIEEKEINLTWHYRNADPEFGAWQASELQVNLEKILSHMALAIIMGNKTLELRPSSADKATGTRVILRDLGLNEYNVDFCLCIGDGKTDEPVFAKLNSKLPGALTCTVGRKQTEATYYVPGVKEVQDILSRLAKVGQHI
jgi:trehalose 6-phosphate synthase/phosphatase